MIKEDEIDPNHAWKYKFELWHRKSSLCQIMLTMTWCREHQPAISVLLNFMSPEKDEGFNTSLWFGHGIFIDFIHSAEIRAEKGKIKVTFLHHFYMLKFSLNFPPTFFAEYFKELLQARKSFQQHTCYERINYFIRRWILKHFWGFTL